MNANRKAVKRAEHKRFSRERQEIRFRNKQGWLERRIEALGDQTDDAIATLLGKTKDWIDKYRYQTHR